MGEGVRTHIVTEAEAAAGFFFFIFFSAHSHRFLLMPRRLALRCAQAFTASTTCIYHCLPKASK